jgi:hypothetical protein
MALPIFRTPQTMHVDNFVSVILQATEEEQAAGLAWYQVYHNRIVERGQEARLSPSAVADSLVGSPPY